MVTGLFTRITGMENSAVAAQRMEELPGALRQKIEAYSPGREQNSRLCGKLLLAKLLTDNGLNEHLTLNGIHYNVFARPVIDASFDFSIAHSGDMVICVLAIGCKVGVDTEKVSKVDIDVFKAHFTPREWACINEGGRGHGNFYAAWTAKEAVMKATGKGIFLPMDEFEVSDGSTFVDGSVYYIYTVTVAADYAASIATDQKDAVISIGEIGMEELMALPVRWGEKISL